jgi:hypothetical protein
MLKLLQENFGTDFTVDTRLIRSIMSGQVREPSSPLHLQPVFRSVCA